MSSTLPYDLLVKNNGNLDLTIPELNTIAAFVMENERQNKSAKYLEVGVWGGGTIKTLKNKTISTHFTGIDLFEDFINSSDNTHTSGTFRRDDVQRFLGDRVNLIKGSSDIVLASLEEKFDFIFIDGNHSSVAARKDFELSQRILAEGGQIAFHNCSTHAQFDRDYVNNDGGPWLVTMEVIKSGQWNLLYDIDRLKVFSKKG